MVTFVSWNEFQEALHIDPEAVLKALKSLCDEDEYIESRLMLQLAVYRTRTILEAEGSALIHQIE